MDLQTWGWIFLVVYVGGMLLFGFLGMKRVQGADDFATARGGYGPLFLSLALTATTASGATFLGIPALAYRLGLPALWYAFTYPIGVYVGVLLCIKMVSTFGNTHGSRSIPEFLGDRYQSDAMRIIVALFSLMLLFYLAGQLVAGQIMFDQMLGLSPGWAMIITTIVLTVYVTLGGAHADILTDGVQGALMLVLAAAIGVLFVVGYGVDGGVGEIMTRLEELDPNTTMAFYPGDMLVGSWWGVIAIVDS